MKHASPLCTSIAKNTATPQNKYHPELSENQAVWKSNSQGVKEATFIHKLGRVEMHRGVKMWSGAQRCRDGNGWSRYT